MGKRMQEIGSESFNLVDSAVNIVKNTVGIAVDAVKGIVNGILGNNSK